VDLHLPQCVRIEMARFGTSLYFAVVVRQVQEYRIYVTRIYYSMAFQKFNISILLTERAKSPIRQDREFFLSSDVCLYVCVSVQSRRHSFQAILTQILSRDFFARGERGEICLSYSFKRILIILRRNVKFLVPHRFL